MTSKRDDLSAIFRLVVRHQADVRCMEPSRRQINVYESMKGASIRVTRHEVKVDAAYVVSGDPMVAASAALDLIAAYEEREHLERYRQIVQIKSEMMRQAEYLKRKLSREAYAELLDSLRSPTLTEPDDVS